jgi:hypothetical protein
LRALDDNGVKYKSTWSSINGLSGGIEHLEPEQTYYDKRCWGGAGTGPVRPVTRMELVSIDELKASAMPGTDDVDAGEWQKIGDGGNLEQYIYFVIRDEPPNSYPFNKYQLSPGSSSADHTGDSGFLVWVGWDIANLSDTKTLHIRGCVSYRWRGAANYIGSWEGAAGRISNAKNIPNNSVHTNLCQDRIVRPKETNGWFGHNSSSGLGWYYHNQFTKVLGVWVREE